MAYKTEERRHLSPAGKKIVGPYFHLYTMRHTFATHHYDYYRDIERTSKALGHTKITNTIKYIHMAQAMREQVHGNLFNLALKPYNINKNILVGEWRKTGQRQKWGQPDNFSPYKLSGLSRIRTGDLRRVKATS